VEYGAPKAGFSFQSCFDKFLDVLWLLFHHSSAVIVDSTGASFILCLRILFPCLVLSRFTQTKCHISNVDNIHILHHLNVFSFSLEMFRNIYKFSVLFYTFPLTTPLSIIDLSSDKAFHLYCSNKKLVCHTDQRFLRNSCNHRHVVQLLACTSEQVGAKKGSSAPSAVQRAPISLNKRRP
jgi:hypothetical protein